MTKLKSVITSSPSSIMPTSVVTPANPHHSAAERRKPFVLIAIIIGDFLVLVIISLILYCYFWRSYVEKMGDGRKKGMSKVLAVKKIVYSTSPYPVNPPGNCGCDREKMVFFDAGARRFELKDLVRVSVEMLGKRWMGTAYKAVLEDGSVVAVKRLRDVGNGGMGRREVEEMIEVLGGFRHEKVVGLRAYYFSRELVQASSRESLLERLKVVARAEVELDGVVELVSVDIVDLSDVEVAAGDAREELEGGEAEFRWEG